MTVVALQDDVMLNLAGGLCTVAIVRSGSPGLLFAANDVDKSSCIFT